MVGIVKTDHRRLFSTSVDVKLCEGVESVAVSPRLCAWIQQDFRKGCSEFTGPLRGCLSSWDLFLNEKLEGWSALVLISFSVSCVN